MINGNTTGVRRYDLEQLDKIYEMKFSSGDFAPKELLDIMAEYTGKLNREISVFLGRNGAVLDVSIGTNSDVQMPSIRKRRGTVTLSGVRCLHTHPNATSMLSTVDLGTLSSARMDAMCAISVRDGKAISLTAAFIGEALNKPVIYGPFAADKIPNSNLTEEITLATRRVAEIVSMTDASDKKERAILVGLNATDASMHELARLAETADVEVVYVDVQKRPRDGSMYIGKGKVHELSQVATSLEADTFIFNDDLSPSEQRNLEDALHLKFIDRTTLILDIFARHAKSREGCLQVELAQLKYNLPRLVGMWTFFSRSGGGIGTVGPGETQIELDKRMIRRRIFELEREIKRLEAQRKLRRASRERNRMKQIALVGYTNAGKSSLLNAISNADVLAVDKLFATLDPVTRRAELPSGRTALFTDTVGFIEKLPHDLVDAFRSTLEEALQADLLLIVVDISDENHIHQMDVVKEVLGSLGAEDKNILFVYNKCDRLIETPQNSENAYFISAKTGEGIPALLAAIDEKFAPQYVDLTVELEYSESALMALIQRNAKGNVEIDYGERMKISANVPREVEEEIMETLIRKGRIKIQKEEDYY
ncbi:MAG: GTPase HflX [Christensenellaceae bacterium]|nr:GTPase HflX [Christensenellaceae bacterium]